MAEPHNLALLACQGSKGRMEVLHRAQFDDSALPDKLILKVLRSSEGQLIFGDLPEARRRRALRKDRVRSHPAHIRPFGIVCAPRFHHSVYFFQDLISRHQRRAFATFELADTPKLKALSFRVAVRHLPLFRIRANPSRLTSTPIRNPTVKAFPARAARIVDARHIMPDALRHLPRAVVSGVSEMLPPINAIGPALLAAFAVEGVIHFGEMVAKDTEKLYGMGEAEKALSEAGRENLRIMEEQARASMTYARSQAALLETQMARQARYVQQLHEWEDDRVKWLGWFGEKGMALSGATKKIADEEAVLTNLEQTRDAIVKTLGEDEKEAHEKAAAGAKEEAEKKAAAAKKLGSRIVGSLFHGVCNCRATGLTWSIALRFISRSI